MFQKVSGTRKIKFQRVAIKIFRQKFSVPFFLKIFVQEPFSISIKFGYRIIFCIVLVSHFFLSRIFRLTLPKVLWRKPSIFQINSFIEIIFDSRG